MIQQCVMLLLVAALVSCNEVHGQHKNRAHDRVKKSLAAMEGHIEVMFEKSKQQLADVDKEIAEGRLAGDQALHERRKAQSHITRLCDRVAREAEGLELRRVQVHNDESKQRLGALVKRCEEVEEQFDEVKRRRELRQRRQGRLNNGKRTQTVK